MDNWQDDLLGRKQDAQNISTFLRGKIEERRSSGSKASYVLNLDAPWGTGKTFFLDRLANELRQEGHLVAYVNAWLDDFSEDPFISVMSSINEVLKPYENRGSTKKTLQNLRENAGTLMRAIAVGAAKQLGRRLVGDAVDALGDALNGATQNPTAADVVIDAAKGGIEAGFSKLDDVFAEKKLAEFHEARQSITGFRRALESLLVSVEREANVPLPMFVLVDELDRCRPSFAIAMLERIKHLFEADNVAFLIATDTTQLSHSIKVVYGSDFNASGYLGRFFDRTYRFDPPNLVDLIKHTLLVSPLDARKVEKFPNEDGFLDYLNSASRSFGVSPREFAQAYDLMSTVVALWNERVGVEIGVLYPLTLAEVRRVNVRMHHDLANDLVAKRTTDYPEPHVGGTVFYDDNGRAEKINAVDLFRTFVELHSEPLPDIGREQYSGVTRSLVVQRLQREYQVVHSGTWRTNSAKPTSLLRNYASLVKRAGHFH